MEARQEAHVARQLQFDEGGQRFERCLPIFHPADAARGGRARLPPRRFPALALQLVPLQGGPLGGFLIMAARILVIGNRNYSSWSLRPWLFMKQNAIAFEEVCIPLYQAGSKERLLKYSPSGKVPVLVEGEIRIWDSLAILEYLAETHPGIRGWPADTIARATARSACAEMHSGFPALRENLSMNVRKVFAPRTWPAEVGA